METAHEQTSATGGSATSQAQWLEERQWRPNRAISWSIRAFMFLLPLAASWLTVALLSQALRRPHDPVYFGAWAFLMLGAAFAAATVTTRLVRGLAPMALLYRLTLVFPDNAPSKFKLALRTMTGRDLEKAANRGSAKQDLLTPQQAAETLLVLVAKLSEHDRLTRGHSERVRAYSVLLGKEIGLSRSDLNKLQWAALIHDIGKLEVPPEILSKDDRPTSTEWAIIRRHPAAGSDYVARVRLWLGDWVDAATQHHERYDGTGYPYGLKGKEISLAGRLVAITDAYDTMTATRSYKPAIPDEQARAELTANAGTQFDPDLVKAFMRISLKQRRGVLGPLGFFAHFPEMLHAPAVLAAKGVTAGVAGVVAAVMSGLTFEPAPAGFDQSDVTDLAFADSAPPVDIDPIPITADSLATAGPAAANDEATVAANETIVIDILANDWFPVADPIPASMEIVASPRFAAGATENDQTITYTAGPDTGIDRLTYRICNAAERCTDAEVTVTITDG